MAATSERGGGLVLRQIELDGWSLSALHGERCREPLALVVRGAIGNSITTSASGAKRTADWKRSVCCAVFKARGGAPWHAGATYLVTIAFRFCPGLHGNMHLDPENFVKPTVDAAAAGLFLPAGADPSAVERYDFDDSGFRHLLIHRLNDTDRPSEEGVTIHITCHEK